MSALPLQYPDVFERLLAGNLGPEVARQSFDAIFAGAWSPVQIAGFLAALRVRGETSEEIEAAARAMRAVMVPVIHDLPACLDTCGTGGDGSGSVNLSTGAAIICAALGVPVTKHGNRAASSKSGSADVLEALGIPLDLDAAQAGAVLREVGITFLLAPNHHPAMRFAGPVRKELKVRTIFNCLGPLANPASATHQLIGAFSSELRPMLGQALRALGTKRAWVVRSDDGMDEISPFGPTRVTQLDGGALSELVVQPSDFGLEPSRPGAVDGSTPERNAQILLSVLRGEAHPSRDAFVLNAAGALVVAEAIAPAEAAAKAARCLDDGSALAKLQAWREASNRARGN